MQQVDASDLEPPHCSVHLEKEGELWIGNTPDQGCPSNFRGAAFVRNRVILSPDGMKTFDQGLDENGNLVWGSDGEPYVFVRQPAAP